MIQNALQDYEPFWKAFHHQTQPRAGHTGSLSALSTEVSLDEHGLSHANYQTFLNEPASELLQQNRKHTRLNNSRSSPPQNKSDLTAKDLLRLKPEGLYAYGGPGSGKSLILGLAFDSLDTEFKLKMSFDDFMSEVHASIGTFARVLYA